MSVPLEAEARVQPAPRAAAGRRRLLRYLADEGRQLARVSNPRLALCSGLAGLLPDFALVGVRARLYRLGGCGVGPRVALQGDLTLVGDGDAGGRLRVGEGSIIAPRVTFGLDAPITIGRNVSIGPGATLYTATHDLGFGSRRMRLPLAARPITVGDGVWIGMQSLILPGVTLGRGCVVSAGSVVTEDVPADALVSGNPAEVRLTLPLGDR